MAVVKVKRGDLEGALRQLRAECKKEGITRKCMEKKFYVKPGDEKRRKKSEAVRASKRAAKKRR